MTKTHHKIWIATWIALILYALITALGESAFRVWVVASVSGFMLARSIAEYLEQTK